MKLNDDDKQLVFAIIVFILSFFIGLSVSNHSDDNNTQRQESRYVTE